MLIINIVPNEGVNFKGRFFKKQVRPEPFQRNCVKVRNMPCTIIEFNESMLETLKLERLFNSFKGRILGSDKNIKRLVPIDYRFNFKPYFKRALLSALIKNLDNNVNLSLCIKDDDFILTKEYEQIAKKVKVFTLISKENKDTERFKNHCFVEYGLFVKVTEKYHSTEDEIYIDFNNIDDNGKIFIKKEGIDQLLYPDPQFFMINEDLRPLLKYGISPKLLCAAFGATQ